MSILGACRQRLLKAYHAQSVAKVAVHVQKMRDIYEREKLGKHAQRAQKLDAHQLINPP